MTYQEDRASKAALRLGEEISYPNQVSKTFSGRRGKRKVTPYVLPLMAAEQRRIRGSLTTLILSSAVEEDMLLRSRNNTQNEVYRVTISNGP